MEAALPHIEVGRGAHYQAAAQFGPPSNMSAISPMHAYNSHEDVEMNEPEQRAKP